MRAKSKCYEDDRKRGGGTKDRFFGNLAVTCFRHPHDGLFDRPANRRSKNLFIYLLEKHPWTKFGPIALGLLNKDQLLSEIIHINVHTSFIDKKKSDK